jgi:hypothetical protein
VRGGSGAVDLGSAAIGYDLGKLNSTIKAVKIIAKEFKYDLSAFG